MSATLPIDVQCTHRAPLRQESRRRLTLVLGITAAVMVAEAVGGWLAHSLALLADVEILAALVNGATLIVIALGIGLEASRRFRSPAEVQGTLLLIIAAVGLAANAVGAAILHRGHDHSLNQRGAYLHIVSDLLGSVGALLAGVIILATGWVQADAVISVLISLLILGSAWRLVKESTDVLLEAAPAHIALVVQNPADNQRVLEAVQACLGGMGISHVTVQMERDPTCE